MYTRISSHIDSVMWAHSLQIFKKLLCQVFQSSTALLTVMYYTYTYNKCAMPVQNEHFVIIFLLFQFSVYISV